MSAADLPTFLLACYEPALREALEPVLAALGATVEVAFSAEAALDAMKDTDAPDMALVDACLPGMEMGEFLVQARLASKRQSFPIVSILDALTDVWVERLRAGLIDDVLLRSSGAGFWMLRIELAMRAHRQFQELQALHANTTEKARHDPLTGAYNREAMLSQLFRETDRAQRLKSPLCLVLFDIDDFGHWNSRLGMAVCDELLRQVASRTMRLLRSYDQLGRPGKDEFLVALPGCSKENAFLFAERLRLEVFSAPFLMSGEAIRLSACFGVASSLGRSPVVVLREAEEALKRAREAGPESIQCFGEEAAPPAAPIIYLSPSGDELVAW